MLQTQGSTLSNICYVCFTVFEPDLNSKALNTNDITMHPMIEAHHEDGVSSVCSAERQSRSTSGVRKLLMQMQYESLWRDGKGEIQYEFLH